MMTNEQLRSLLDSLFYGSQSDPKRMILHTGYKGYKLFKNAIMREWYNKYLKNFSKNKDKKRIVNTISKLKRNYKCKKLK